MYCKIRCVLKYTLVVCVLCLTGCSEPQSYFDQHTGLRWMHCPAGQEFIKGECQGRAKTMHWDESLRYCHDLSVEGLSWHLASRNELLQYYVHYGVQKMSIINLYWTSSTDVENPELAWYLIPRLNWLYANLKELDGLVLCVTS